MVIDDMSMPLLRILLPRNVVNTFNCHCLLSDVERVQDVGVAPGEVLGRGLQPSVLVYLLVHLQHSAVQCSAVQYSTVQYSTVQYSTVQYSTVRYSTVLYQRFQRTIGAKDVKGQRVPRVPVSKAQKVYSGA